MSEILFTCPACSKAMAADESGTGLVVPCTDCGVPVTIPEGVIPIACPGCAQALRASESVQGGVLACPACGHELAIPGVAQQGAAGEGSRTIVVRSAPATPVFPAPPGAAGDRAARPSPFIPRPDAARPWIERVSFRRRFWLLVFASCAFLLGVVYVDVVLDAGLRLTSRLAASRRAPPAEPRMVSRSLGTGAQDAIAPLPALSTGRDELPLPPMPPTPAAMPAAGAAPLPPLPPAPAATGAVAAAEAPRAAAPEPSAATLTELESARRIYEQNLRDIASEQEQDLNEWATNYVGKLAALQGEMQQAGDLDGWTVARDELARFRAAREIPEESLLRAPAGLAAAQLFFRDRHERLLIAHSRNVVTLSRHYTGYLEELQKKLTRQGDMPAALAVNAELRSARSRAEVSAAEFQLAVIEARLTQEAGATQAAAAPPAGVATARVEQAQAPPPAPAPAEARDGAPVIYGGQPAAPPPGVVFGAREIRATGPVRYRKDFDIGIMLGVASNVHSTSETAVGVTTATSQAEVRHYVRIGVRLLPKGRRLAQTRARIEYFIRGPAGRDGKPQPQRMATDQAMLPELSNDWTFIDCPPVITRHWSTEYRGEGFHRTAASGEEFQGLTLRLLAENGETLIEATAAK